MLDKRASLSNGIGKRSGRNSRDHRHQIKDKSSWIFNRTKGYMSFSIPALRSFCELSTVSPLSSNLIVSFGLFRGIWSGEQWSGSQKILASAGPPVSCCILDESFSFWVLVSPFLKYRLPQPDSVLYMEGTHVKYPQESWGLPQLKPPETNICFSKSSKYERRKELGCIKDSRDNLDSSSIWLLWWL